MQLNKDHATKTCRLLVIRFNKIRERMRSNSGTLYCNYFYSLKQKMQNNKLQARASRIQVKGWSSARKKKKKPYIFIIHIHSLNVRSDTRLPSLMPAGSFLSNNIILVCCLQQFQNEWQLRIWCHLQFNFLFFWSSLCLSQQCAVQNWKSKKTKSSCHVL